MKDIKIFEIVSHLESVYRCIHLERMADVPICNNNIDIRAIGFRAWQNSILGVMITPWFMNLMLLPGDSENWEELKEQDSQTHLFPSGRYQFLIGFESDLGKYQTCSLFSPMFEFADNQAAQETAQAVLKELMDEKNIDENLTHAAQIESIWKGEKEALTDDGFEETETHDLSLTQQEQLDEDTNSEPQEIRRHSFNRRNLLFGNVYPKNTNTNE